MKVSCPSDLHEKLPGKLRNSKSHQPHQTSLFSVRYYETSVFDSLWLSFIVVSVELAELFFHAKHGWTQWYKKSITRICIGLSKTSAQCCSNFDQTTLSFCLLFQSFSLTSRHHDPIITSHWSHLYQLLELLKSATFVPLYPFRREPLSHFDFPMEDQTKCRKNLTIWHLTKNGKKQTKQTKLLTAKGLPRIKMILDQHQDRVGVWCLSLIYISTGHYILYHAVVRMLPEPGLHCIAPAPPTPGTGYSFCHGSVAQLLSCRENVKWAMSHAMYCDVPCDPCVTSHYSHCVLPALTNTDTVSFPKQLEPLQAHLGKRPQALTDMTTKHNKHDKSGPLM